MEVIFKRRLHKAVGVENSRHREPGYGLEQSLEILKRKMYYPEKGKKKKFSKTTFCVRCPQHQE